MNKFKKIFSLVLAFVIFITGCVSAFAQTDSIPTEPMGVESSDNETPSAAEQVNHFDEIELGGSEDYKNFLLKFSRPTVTTELFLKITNFFNIITRLLTGRIFFPEHNFNVTVDEFTQTISDHIVKKSGIDLVAFAKDLPDISRPADIATTVLNLDTTKVREAFYAKRDELYANGDEPTSIFYHFLGMYFSVIAECEIYSKPVDGKDNTKELVIRLHFKDGVSEDIYPGVHINTETGEFTNCNDSGMFGSGFNFNLNEMITYATVSCWMRDYGFCVSYDIIANSMPLLFRYNTRRFHFDYDGLEWMVQIWKGNYIVANGGEVGLYNRDPANSIGTYYNCADETQMLDMSMQIFAGDKLLVNKPVQPHWWINGFSLTDRVYPAGGLTMKFSITMRDEEMLAAFTQAIDNNIMNDVYYTVDGLTVYVIW